MSVYKKPHLHVSEVETTLNNYFGSTVSTIEPIASDNGNLSSVFSFVFEEKGYVIKFSDLEGAYELEPIISRLLSTQGVPFPRCVGQGKLANLNFVISDLIVGQTLDHYSFEQKQQQLPELMKLMWQMNHVDLGTTIGFGSITTTGDGQYSTWKQCIVSTYAEDQSGTFWDNWDNLFKTSFLEKDVFEECYSRLLEYAAFNAPHRYFIHGDFHQWNILSDGQRITGIVDGNFAYGDFLIDLAVLATHMPYCNIIQTYQNYLDQANVIIPDFKERLLGAYYFKGLDGLRFYAKMGQKDAYNSMRSFLLNLTN